MPVLRNLLVKNKEFFVILLAAISMSFYLIYRFPNVGGDTLSFLLPIHHWVAGDGYSLGGKPELLFSPGYGILSGLIYLLVHDIEYSGMFVSGLSFVGIVVSAYIGVGRLFDKRAGLIAALFLSFSPSHVALSYISLADLPVAFFILLGAFMTLKVILVPCSNLWFFLNGLILGFGTLIRPDCLIVAGGAFALILLAIFGRVRRSEISAARGFVAIASFVTSFLSCIVPYMAFLHQHTGVWTVSNKLALVIVGGSGISNLPVDASLTATIISEFSHNLIALVSRVRENFLLCIYSLIVCTFYIIIPVFLVWLAHPFIAFRKFGYSIINLEAVKYGLGVLLIFSTPLVPYLFYARDDRRWIPYWTLIIIAGAVLVYFFLRGIIRDDATRSWRITYWVLGLLVIISPHFPVPSLLKPHSLLESLTIGHGHYGLRDAGNWLRDNAPLEDRIKVLSRKPQVVVFYATNKSIAPSYGYGINQRIGLEKNIEMLKEFDLKYLVLDEYYIKNMPLFAPLWVNPEYGKKYGISLVSSSSNISFKIFQRE